jgi:hypothetical protein
MKKSEFCGICKLLSRKYYRMRKDNYYYVCCDDCMKESEEILYNDKVMGHYDVNNIEHYLNNK